MTTLKANSFADLIAFGRSTLGYEPADKLVAIFGTADALMSVMSVELPHDGLAALDAVGVLLSTGEKIGAKAMALVIYPEGEYNDQAEVEGGLMALTWTLKITQTDILNLGSALVADTCWVDYSHPDVRRDLSEINDSAVAAGLVFHGVAKDRPVTIPEPDKASATTTLNALNFRGALPKMDFNDLSQQDIRRLRDAWDLWTNVVTRGGELSEREATDLIGYFQHPLFRDLFVAYAAGDGFDMENFGKSTADSLHKLVAAGTADMMPRVKAVRVAALELLRWAEDGQRTDILALTGFTYWFTGQGTHAGMFYEKALELDPEHRLSTLLNTILSRGIISKAITDPGAEQYRHLFN